MLRMPISLDQFRRSLDLPKVVELLTREGYEEGAVHRAIATFRAENGAVTTMAEALVGARRKLDLESRHTIVRRR
jgi:hypothetical protein